MGKDKVVDYLDSSEVLAQLAEECSEAAQAALKMRRALDGYSATCPFCGEELRLCNVCQHPYPGRDADDCDRDETTGKCRFSHRCVVEGGQA